MLKPKPSIVHQTKRISERVRKRDVYTGCLHCAETGYDFDEEDRTCKYCDNGMLLSLSLVELGCPCEGKMKLVADRYWEKCKADRCRDGWIPLRVLFTADLELQSTIDACSA